MSVRTLVSDRIVFPDGVRAGLIRIEDGKIAELHDNIVGLSQSDEAFDFTNAVILPGLVDTHVHINEPGRTEWEGFATATQAAAAGGITTLVDMPLNCLPVTTTSANFRAKLDVLGSQLTVDTGFWGGVTPETLPDLPALLEAGVLGVKSFLIDSGIPEFPPMSPEALEPAMRVLARYQLPYLFHAELDLPGKTGEIRRYSDFVRSRPPEWEVEAIRLIIRLARETGCRSHIVHLSAAEALEDIHAARAAGVPISAETCPHYLLLDEETIDARPDTNACGVYKCCPPIRSRGNARKLWDGLLSGDISCIVSDHSPCTANLKEGTLANAWGGISSLQFGLPLIARLAHERGLGTGGAGNAQTLRAIAHWMSEAPAALAGLSDRKGSIAVGKDADFAILDPDVDHKVRAADILYKNKLTPYDGMPARGRVRATILRGELCYASDRGIVGSPRGRPLLQRKMA